MNYLLRVIGGHKACPATKSQCVVASDLTDRQRLNALTYCELQISDHVDKAEIMSLRKALNVLLVAFWVCAQTAMAYGHNASGSSAHDMDKTAKAHMAPNSDCLNHVQSEDEPKSHHSGSSLDQCCSAACSIAGPFAMFELNVDSPSRDFAVELVHAPMAINQGLPTPPPNTTF